MLNVALVGKPNVGKSTLFNRIISKKKAIVSEIPGTTRDRIDEKASWLNSEFLVTDTGGLTNTTQNFDAEIERQVRYAIDESDCILFIVSNKDGVDAKDFYVAKLLKKYKQQNKKVLLLVNKSENTNTTMERQYFALGFGKPYYVSAEHGVGIGDVLDEVIKTKPTLPPKEEEKRTKFCIIGRTNVGKSTLMNCILQKERVVASPIEHTTRDAVDEDFKYQGKNYTIIDTAGIRRKGKIGNGIEKYAVMRTQQAIERSDVILLVLDASTDFNEQDEVIGGLAYKANVPTIIVVNKWDDVKDKDSQTIIKFTKEIRTRFAYLSWAPIVFLSALENKRVHTIFEMIDEVQKQQNIKVSTSLLNDVISKAQLNNPAPQFRGGRINISYSTQAKSQIPTFILFCNNPNYLHFTYGRYMENQIREGFGIKYTPILVYYKDKNARIRSDN